MRAISIAVLLWIAGCRDGEPSPAQPIAFNHKLHAGDQAIPCVDCHDGAETRAHAQLPPLSRCLACHMKPQGDDLAKVRDHMVRELAAKGGPFAWVQITRNPAHVHFSHAAHVSIAKMPCADCHPGVTEWTAPPERPNPALTSMDAYAWRRSCSLRCGSPAFSRIRSHGFAIVV